MFLDITEDIVRSHFANVQMAVMGEVTLIERLTPAISLWEKKLIANFLPHTMMKDPEIEPLCIEVVVYGALLDALPMLDVVLTPNGLATVSNQNLVPASAARSEAARKSLASMLFKAQDVLLAKLKSLPVWRISFYGVSFAQSLFQTLDDLCRLNRQKEECSFDLAMVMQQMASHVENKFARRYISHDLMMHLRYAELEGSLTEHEQFVVSRIKEAVFTAVSSNGFKGEMLIDVVDFIKNHPDSFPLWHNSSTAKMFTDHSFKNDPDAGGFFF